MEARENYHESLQREVKEETNLVIKPKKILGIYYGQSHISGRKVKFIIYLAKIVSGQLKISKEHEKYRFSTIEEIGQLPNMPYMDDFLAGLKQTKLLKFK